MDNVINLFSRRTAPKAAAQTRASEATQTNKSAVGSSGTPSTSSFSEAAERNRANQMRLRKERESANKNVLKSYRIK
ncbi:MAG: hypothetical protein FJY29_01170 [Betaproteobacteria bacterium]|nr:hypothetical protein [Betaproteobacteria bacterium]